MAQGESPAVARRRLRLALRKAREAKGFTQGDVAEALEWSLSKVQRIESGDVKVSRTDLTALLSHLGVRDPDEIDELVELTRRSRGKAKDWWDEPRYQRNVTSAMLQLFQFESDATEIRVFHPTLVPGPLQTAAYAQVILDRWQMELSDEERLVRLDVRLRRQTTLFNGPKPPKYLAVLDESVLLRPLGGRKVMADQLRQLVSLVSENRVQLRIVPMAQAATLAMLNAFILLDLGDGQDEILYREAHITDEITQGAAFVKRYRRWFELAWEAAFDRADTIERIRQQAEEFDGGGSDR